MADWKPFPGTSCGLRGVRVDGGDCERTTKCDHPMCSLAQPLSPYVVDLSLIDKFDYEDDPTPAAGDRREA